jgi:anti-sigma regulatory factor (Ser/Thr protein kinase)
VKRSFPADQKSLSVVRDFVRTQSECRLLTEIKMDELVLAVSEACALVLRHSLDPIIVLSWELAASAIEVTVEDQGVLAPWAGRSEVLEGELGLMEELVDRVVSTSDQQTGRREIRLFKRLPAQASPS